MSYDPNTPPMGAVPPQKSGGSLKWILGGLGCFGLLTVLCIGGLGYWFYSFSQSLLNNPAKTQAISSIEQSDSIAEAFGPPILVKETKPPQTGTDEQEMLLTYSVDVIGSEKSGTATIKVRGNPLDADSFSVESIIVKGPDGEEIPIKKLDLDIQIDEGEPATDTE